MEDKTSYFKKAVLTWYKSNKRAFNWRNTKNPWKILLIEVIAQQTQIERADKYYKKFIKAFPTPKQMATSKYIEVQKLWSGLGYNNRAKRLFEASKIINELGFDKIYPNFQKLPGVGEYTKNALLSFVYDEKVLTRDINLNRILKRFFGSELDKYSKNQFEEVLFKNISSRDLNQSLMDLGSSICSSRNPRCNFCPLEMHCSKDFTNEKSVRVEKFQGSNRELRGQIINLLIKTPMLDKNVIKKNLNTNSSNLNKALVGLEKDGLVNVNKNNLVSINSE